MWTRLRGQDLRVIAHYMGVLSIGAGLAMVVPFATALLTREWAPALDYMFGAGIACGLGVLLALTPTGGTRVTRVHALVLAAISWLGVSALAAIPLMLSGNYVSYIDALFDAVSGLTTSGLTLVTDLDHMALAHNMWRHLLHLIGGQGIIVAAISLAVGPRDGAGFSLYQAEAREERIVPNVLNTARLIWFVTAVYLAAGTAALCAVNLWLGMSPVRAFLQAFWMAIAAFDTGGFAPQSMNAMYYHSVPFNAVLVLLMVGGTMNFNLHVHVWRGHVREMWQDLEMRVLALNALILCAFAAMGLAATKAFSTPLEAVLKGAFHVISAHSGTGHQVIYPGQWTTDYGAMALVAVMLAMAAGGAASSTAGGIKSLRIGITIKSVLLRVRRSLAPRSAVVSTHYHHLRTQLLTPEIMTGAMAIAILYAVTYISGAVIGAAYGYPASEALFESISATANVGLSAGVTNPSMPVGLKFVYMAQMWAGRLEFVAVLALIAHIILALPRARKGRVS